MAYSYGPPNPLEKPGQVTTIAVGTLVVGILNIMLGLAWAFALLFTLICWPLAAYPITLGILEIIYAAKLLSNPPRPVRPAKYLAIMEICNIVFGSVWSLALGIVALIFYNEPAVQAFFARINGASPQAAPAYPPQPPANYPPPPGA